MRDAQGFYGLASGGIGFAMAGAVGISVALPDRPVVAIVGDGSAMYSIQALWTAAHLKLPITYVIRNNRSYRILKERLVSMRGPSKFIGMDLRDPEIDFVALAQSMGVPAKRITDAQDVVPALRAAIASGVPNLLDISVRTASVHAQTRSNCSDHIVYLRSRNDCDTWLGLPSFRCLQSPACFDQIHLHLQTN